MTRLSLLSIVFITLLSITVVSESSEDNLVDMFNRTSMVESNLWKKFTGEITDPNVPDIIDWSYAGYKNGREGIPDVTRGRYSIIDVTDFGAIPNDGKDDMPHFQEAIGSAKQYTIVYIPPGVYDLNVEPNSPDIEGASSQWIEVRNSYVVIKGAGAVGAEHGGTTLRMHTPFDDWGKYLFNTKWRDWHIREPTYPVREYPKGVMSFEVKDATRISNHFHSGQKQFVKIYNQVKDGVMYDANISRPLNEISADFTNIHKDGATIQEVHEIADVKGNTIYIKAPLTTPITPECQVDINALFLGIGYEEFHLDCGLNVPFTHKWDGQPHGKDGQYGFNGINMGYTAHSWIKNVRVSNSSAPFRGGVYANSIVNVFLDGNRGHHPITIAAGMYIFVGPMHSATTTNMWHGEAVEGQGTANVYWLVGGSTLPGPDAHANFPRFTLFDNCFHTTHQASGSVTANRPNHLDGYTRWNNITTDDSTFDLWGGFTYTQSNIIGYVSGGAASIDGYVESHGTPVTPNSLYVAQLKRRLGTTPNWIRELKTDYHILFDALYNGKVYLPPKLEIVKVESGPKIEGPWLWVLVPDERLDNNTDLLAKVSGDTITEQDITTNGVSEGDTVGDYAWTPLKISPIGDQNLHDMTRPLGWNGSNRVIYGFISLDFPKEQNIMMFVGSDDSVKVWLNGELIHREILVRGAEDYQSSFPVTLKQGRNTLLVAVGNGGGGWSGFFGFQSTAEYTLIPLTTETRLPADVNGDGRVNVLDLVTVARSLGKPASNNPAADLNDDGVINVLDLVIVAKNLGQSAQAAAPHLIADAHREGLTPEMVRTWIKLAQTEHDGSLVFEQGIALLQRLLAVLIPNKTALLQNYPNPFNPETWIPYQLEKPSNVSITIYDIGGNVVRQLDLGQQNAGYYSNRSRAAYWDGRNNIGERVATGVYFYKLKADDYSNLRKMLILK